MTGNKLKSYDREEVAQALRDEGLNSKANRYLDCKEDQVVINCRDCGNVELYDKTCQLGVCDKCESSKKLEVFQRYRQIARHIDNPLQIEVTKKNTKDLTKEDLREIRDQFHELRDRISDLSAQEIINHECWENVADSNKSRDIGIMVENGWDIEIKGGIYAIETKNVNGSWNTHIHALLDVKYIPQPILSALWEDVSGDPVVHVQSVNDTDSAISYLTKYMCKPPEIEQVEDLAVYERATHNLRLMGSFGHLYNIDVEDIESECPECGSTNLEWIGSASFWSGFMSDSSPETKDPPDQTKLFIPA